MEHPNERQVERTQKTASKRDIEIPFLGTCETRGSSQSVSAVRIRNLERTFPNPELRRTQGALGGLGEGWECAYNPLLAIAVPGASENMSSRPKAVVLLSGGLDSTTVLAIAQAAGFEPCALTFRYGQRHEYEIDAAAEIAKSAQVEKHVVIDFDLRTFGGSALTSAIDVPKHDSAEEIGDAIPVTYVPARNTIFLSFAMAYAEVLSAQDIFIGVNALDYSGYPDCRPEFIEAFQQMANLATQAGVEGNGVTIHTPLLKMTKAEIIRRGLELGVDYGQTISCYDPQPDRSSCGRCDACLLRLRGFEQNGVKDPIRYSDH